MSPAVRVKLCELLRLSTHYIPGVFPPLVTLYKISQSDVSRRLITDLRLFRPIGIASSSFEKENRQKLLAGLIDGIVGHRFADRNRTAVYLVFSFYS